MPNPGIPENESVDSGATAMPQLTESDSACSLSDHSFSSGPRPDTSNSTQTQNIPLKERIEASHVDPTSPFYTIQAGPSTISCYYLSRQHFLGINAKGLIFDADETQFQGSAEHYHDGAGGRFSLALQELLHREGVSFRDRLNWDAYTRHAGGSVPHVCSGICDQASAEFAVKLNPLEYQKEVERVSKDRFHELMERVRLMPGVRELLLESRNRGIRLATCSASEPEFVTSALRKFGIEEYFDFILGNAVKKIPLQEGQRHNLFSGESILKCAEALSLSAYECAMFGDSISDAGASLIAGLPLTVIRPIAAGKEPHELIEAIQDMTLRVADVVQRQADKIPPVGELALFYIEGFDQIFTEKTERDFKPASWGVFTRD